MESKKILELGKMKSKVTAESADNTLEVKWMMIKNNILENIKTTEKHAIKWVFLLCQKFLC